MSSKPRILIVVSDGVVMQVFSPHPDVVVEIFDTQPLLAGGTPRAKIEEKILDRASLLYLNYGE